MPKGVFCVVTKNRAIVLCAIFAGSLLVVGLLVYFLADRPLQTNSTCEDAIASLSSQNSSSIISANRTSAQNKHKHGKDVRLPRKILPRHYDLRLLPVLQNANFTILGQVSIELECFEDTDQIVLHSLDIAVDTKSVTVTDKNAIRDNLLLNGIKFDKDVEFLIVELNAKLIKGHTYTLSMDFTGVLSDQLKGFYRSSYMEGGVEKFLAVSQMEPTDARRSFPCFDEPNMKATFTVTLGRHKDMISISNMPLINTTPIDGMDNFFWDHFEKSVPMSTYLVAFVVANFTRVGTSDFNNSKWGFNIYSRPGASNQTQYAQDVGPKIQTFYEDYFQIPFPLPKQDMIAIPDFNGAMENWGLVTYRESFLLYDPEISSLHNKLDIAQTIAHELAHMWFGNLVTMDWWTDLWLKEGFANYLSYIGVEHVEPSLQLMEQFIVMEIHGAMTLDALESSHPISVDVKDPSEIFEIFDSISYQKGATLIRMLAHFIGEKSFREGLTNYLNARKYGNAIQDDLWEFFSEQAKVNKVLLPASVKELMDSWTLKMGYPVVTINRDYNSRKVSVNQERFLMQQSNSTKLDKIVWWIPLSYTADFKTIGTNWLSDQESKKEMTLDFDVASNQWLIFNVESTGYYRVNYDHKNWQLIAEQLNADPTKISIINRAQIMNDALNLAQANILDYETALDLTKYLERETEYLPWKALFSSLDYITSMLSRSSGNRFFKKYLKKLVTPLYQHLGFSKKDNDTILTKLLRKRALSLACTVGNRECTSNAKDYFSRWMLDPDNKDIIEPDLKSSVLCTAIREGSETEWDFVLDRYLKSNVATEKSTLLSSLTCTGQSWLLAQLLEMSLNGTSGMPKQDIPIVIREVAGNSLGRYMAFNFVKEHWNELNKIMLGFDAASIVQSIGDSFNTRSELQELINFRDDHQKELANWDKTIQQSLDRATNNLNWMKRNYRKVVDWLQRN